MACATARDGIVDALCAMCCCQPRRNTRTVVIYKPGTVVPELEELEVRHMPVLSPRAHSPLDAFVGICMYVRSAAVVPEGAGGGGPRGPDPHGEASAAAASQRRQGRPCRARRGRGLQDRAAVQSARQALGRRGAGGAAAVPRACACVCLVTCCVDGVCVRACVSDQEMLRKRKLQNTGQGFASTGEE